MEEMEKEGEWSGILGIVLYWALLDNEEEGRERPRREIERRRVVRPLNNLGVNCEEKTLQEL